MGKSIYDKSFYQVKKEEKTSRKVISIHARMPKILGRLRACLLLFSSFDKIFEIKKVIETHLENILICHADESFLQFVFSPLLKFL